MLKQNTVLVRPSIRTATAADAGRLAQLCEAHAAYERLGFEPQGHAERLAEALTAQRINVWLAQIADEVVGYASVTLDYATLTAQRFLHLDCLYLDAHARGHGLGQQLFDEVTRFGQAQGCANLQWQTPVWNADGIRFYDRTGATRLEKQRYTLGLL